MSVQLQELFTKRPDLEMVALGSEVHRAQLDLLPLGIPVQFRSAESSPELVQAYHALNHQAFAAPLYLPGWVLADLFLLPGAVGLLVGAQDGLDTRWSLPRLADGSTRRR